MTSVAVVTPGRRFGAAADSLSAASWIGFVGDKTIARDAEQGASRHEQGVR
jgi:hypothetical protein